MWSRVRRLNFLLCLNTRGSSFKALAKVFEGLYFLLPIYCEQNKTTRSEINNGIVILIYHWTKSYTYFLGTAQFWSKSNVICSTESLIFMHPDNRQQNHSTEWDCFKRKVRFSDALLVSHGIIQTMIRQYNIRQSLQNIFKFIFMQNWSTFCTYVTRWSGFAVGTPSNNVFIDPFQIYYKT